MSRYQDEINPHTVHIYALLDPTVSDNRVFYIGKTRCELSERLHLHNTAARKGKPTKTCDRIRRILSVGHKPEIRLIVDVNSTVSRNVEREIIQNARNSGIELTNMSAGGGGG